MQFNDWKFNDFIFFVLRSKISGNRLIRINLIRVETIKEYIQDILVFLMSTNALFF